MISGSSSAAATSSAFSMIAFPKFGLFTYVSAPDSIESTDILASGVIVATTLCPYTTRTGSTATWPPSSPTTTGVTFNLYLSATPVSSVVVAPVTESV